MHYINKYFHAFSENVGILIQRMEQDSELESYLKFPTKKLKQRQNEHV